MAAIIFKTTSGALPITAYLMQGITEIASTVCSQHNVEYSFLDISPGQYRLKFVDNNGCTKESTLLLEDICTAIEMGDGYNCTPYFTPALYRNYEMDTTLPLADYVGRTKPIQTAIEFVESGTGYIILRNMPYIQELVDHPENFGMFNVSTVIQPDQALKTITSLEYLGTYSGNSNCVKFYNSDVYTGTLGDKFILFNIYPRGIWRNTSKTIQRGTGSWNATYVPGAGAIWKKQNGLYGILATGYNAFGTPTKVKHHLFYANTLDGTWTDQNSSTYDLFDSTVVPSGYIGCNTITGDVVLPNTSQGTLYAGGTAFINPNGTVTVLAIAVWNEDMTIRTAFPISHNYTFTSSLTAYTTLTTYADKFYFAFNDGTAYVGKRVVLVSDCLEGPYTYHSTIVDLSNPAPNVNDGLMYNTSFAHGSLLTMHNRLYFMSSGDNRTNQLAGDLSNHNNFLWLYDDATNTWAPVISAFPFLTSPHTTYQFGFNWGWDHMGYMAGFYQEGDKLWFTNAMNEGTDTYEVTNGYFDLSVACIHPDSVYYNGENLLYNGEQVIFTT